MLSTLLNLRDTMGKTVVEGHIIREITPLSGKDCFYIADRNKTEFTYPMHCHKEFELNFVENAAGVQRIVGDSAEIIQDYDLVLITSPDLEHVWEQGTCHSDNIREITVQFSADFMKGLLETNQFDEVRKMFEKAQNGLCFPLKAIMKVYSLLDGLSETKGFYAVSKFMTIMYELSMFTKEARALSSSSFARIEVQSDSRRVQKVQDYINRHYQEDLSDYIIDIRLGHATRLLVDSTMAIAEICYECGFNNLSNFNRIFKKKKSCSPKEFREYYRKKRIVI